MSAEATVTGGFKEEGVAKKAKRKWTRKDPLAGWPFAIGFDELLVMDLALFERWTAQIERGHRFVLDTRKRWAEMREPTVGV